MRSRAAVLLCISVFVLSWLRTEPARAQEQGDRTVEQYLCKKIMRESGADRDSAITFLHGFLLGKSGNSRFNLDVLARRTDAFLERCLENPNEKAVDVMRAVTSEITD
jgi:hypothetical protein